MKELAFLILGIGIGAYCAKQKGSAERSRLEGELAAVRAAMEYQRTKESDKKA